MARFLLDTNHLSKAIDKVSPLRDRIGQAYRNGHRFGTSWSALCELEAGIVQTSNPSGSRRRLRLLLKNVRIWPTDKAVVRNFGEVHHTLKQRGRVLSHVDKVLAALALKEDATLLTTDGDFQALPEIRVENWIP